MSTESMSLAKPVLVKKVGRVAHVELNRPEALNALNKEMLLELAKELRLLSMDDDVDVVLLKGKGKAFSSGGDIKTMLASSDESDFHSIMDNISDVALTLYSMPKLTICAINGAAAGLGFSIALASDYSIAAEDAKIAMNFIGIALIPDGGSHFFLERRIGEVKAKELIWEGKVMNAVEAFEKNLIHEVSQDLEASVNLKVQQWLNSPIQAMVKTKKILADMSRPQLQKILELEKHGQLKMRHTQDHAEGIKAFVEKRRPNFQGK